MDKNKNSSTANSTQQLEFEFTNSLPSIEERIIKKKTVIINLQEATKQFIIEQILKNTKCF